MSGEVSERLLAIVPRHLDFATKYELREKLWRKREPNRLSVRIAADAEIRDAIQVVTNAIEHARSERVPAYIIERLNWLTDDDGIAAQALLAQVMTAESEMIASATRIALQQLFILCSERHDKAAQVVAQRQIRLPGAVVVLVLTNEVGSTRMSNDVNKPSHSSGNLVRANTGQQGGQLAPPLDLNNLFAGTVTGLTPEMHAEITNKAADGARTANKGGRQQA